jgi:hypothetical protein
MAQNKSINSNMPHIVRTNIFVQNILLLIFLLFSLCFLSGCNGYKFLSIEQIEPGTLAQRIGFRTEKVTDLCLSGTLDSSDVVYIENLTNGSDLLTSLDLSNTKVSLYDHTFAGCIYLKMVKLPQSSTAVNDYMFSDCKKLQTVILPSECTFIGQETFSDCIRLEEIHFPISLSYIGINAFKNCTGLKKIISAAPIPPHCEPSSFNGISPQCMLIVPKGATSKYHNAVGWEHFINIIEDKNADKNKSTQWGKN